MDVAEDAPLLQLPVEGTWRSLRSPGHERFAFDLAAVAPEGGSTLAVSRLHHLLGRATVTDSFSWNVPVFAPTTGTVVQAEDEWPDRQRLSLLRDLLAMLRPTPDADSGDIGPFAGNHIIIETHGGFVFLAHLRKGSVSVREGDKVAAGQLVGRVGNSGHTLEPHLHFQLFDQIDNLATASAPAFRITSFERLTETGWTTVQGETLPKGETIRSRSTSASVTPSPR